MEKIQTNWFTSIENLAELARYLVDKGGGKLD